MYWSQGARSQICTRIKCGEGRILLTHQMESVNAQSQYAPSQNHSFCENPEVSSDLQKPTQNKICILRNCFVPPAQQSWLDLPCQNQHIAGKSLRRAPQLWEPSFPGVRTESCTKPNCLQRAKPTSWSRCSLEAGAWRFFGETKIWEVFAVTRMCRIAF